MNSEEDLAMMMPGPFLLTSIHPSLPLQMFYRCSSLSLTTSTYIFTSFYTSFGATPADTYRYIYDEGIFTSQK